MTDERQDDCAELARLLGIDPARCCHSCHDEFDADYSFPLEVERGDRTFYVCCAIALAAEEKGE